MKLNKLILSLVCMLLVCVMAANLAGCAASAQAADLMDHVDANTVVGKEVDDAFVASQMRLAVALFQAGAAASKQENVLISPLSVQLALAMTANGANGQTLTEMETLLGGSIPLEQLNEYLYAYVNSLPSDDACKLRIANSIWFRDEAGRLQVEQDFLQKNADYYGAQIYKSAFDTETLKDINNWVDDRTDGMIDKILDEIDEDTVMYLINALVFDGQWETAYNKSDIFSGVFTTYAGAKHNVEMMHSEESKYLCDGLATGFIKDYKNEKYSFAVLLPNEGVDIYDYIASLTGEDLRSTLEGAQSGMVVATMPKFSYDYELTMNDVLKDLGMPSAFTGTTADLSRLGKSSRGNLYIGNVLHKTFITVDALGTKAGAVTKVEVNDECAVMSEWVVNLNRPFVYMIIDNAAQLPVFMGAVTDIEN